MMQRYLQTKEEYKDCILFYRLGDFYEMFFDDAKTASRELELTLTGKNCGLSERAPMCGVPFHSANVYIEKLVAKGYKVAICEQLEDPKDAKGLVDRGVIRVITAGTRTYENMLDEKKNNYFLTVCKEDVTSLVFCDVSTGEVFACEIEDDNSVLNEIARYLPSEVILNPSAKTAFCGEIISRITDAVTEYDDSFFEADEAYLTMQFPKNAKDFAGKSHSLKSALCAMMRYLEHTQKAHIDCISEVSFYSVGEFLEMDFSTRRSLEITETMRDKSKKYSLLWVLDRTKTSMGARKLKQWLEKPLVNPAQINKRLYAVGELKDNIMLSDDFANILSNIYDIGRITNRISLNTAAPRDMVALKNSLLALPELNYLLSKTKSPMLSELNSNFDIMSDIASLLSDSINDEVPISLRDGNVIKEGYNSELDELRRISKDGRAWILGTEAEERERTGIKTLKISYNKVFGYYIEVTKANSDMVPDYYIRKQTLVNAERYITPKLKEMEDKVLGATQRIAELEVRLFDEIRQKIGGEIDRLKKVCDIIATVDAIQSLAQTAFKLGYVMPEVTEKDGITIKDGRHPVVERTLKTGIFVPNDTVMDGAENRELIITGPNMAGKSTYMRQVALITLMAQIGSFVPASYAKIGAVDKIFTRVGASDDIAQGQSTFMLEMVEVSNILKNATAKSLVILDEIGRGTSTYDGLSIAWAVAEHMAEKVKAKTLFATHYHELTDLENDFPEIKNYSVAVKKHGDDITFLRKIIRGGADDSYGIEVAALAGVKKAVIDRAKEILKRIELGDIETAHKQKKKADYSAQIGIEEQSALDIFEELKAMDVTTYTPIEALNKLYEMAKRAKE
ncbi:MAG: DNA mismatch repair protein MutS [Clostridia bacterium]|nr:DNA mismatch repair protein MutS [Clostridia bacterium]